MSIEDGAGNGAESTRGGSSLNYEALLRDAQRDGSEEGPASERAVAELMQDPDVQAGVAAVQEVIRGHYDRLREAGNTVTEVLRGFTPDGQVVQVGSYRGEGPGHPDYVVFTYRLDEVGQPDFAQHIVPQIPVGVDVHRGGGVELTLEDPDGESLPISREDARRLLTDEDEIDDPDEFERLASAYNGWQGRINLHLPQVRDDRPRYGGQTVAGWPGEDRLLQHGQIVQETAPLRERAAEERDLGAAAVERVRFLQERASSPTVEEVREKKEAATTHGQNAETLRERADRTEQIMVANPTMVDRPGVVHDPVKAEVMAHAKAKAMDDVKRGKRAEENLAIADERAAEAARAYEADPLGGVHVKPEKKGWFSRLRGRE